ncbi:MAG: EAL domain-containing protein, partial [Lachnospiraceae bacterium]|nr:EAL domain-containing protein [Lachnospiraceae bacterium]
MERVAYFHICGIIVYTLILIATFVRRATKGLTNRLFITLVCMGLGATVLDLSTELMLLSLPLGRTEAMFAGLLTYLYFILRNGTVVVYLFFIFAVTHTIYGFRDPRKVTVLLLPYFVLLVTLAFNPVTHGVFAITSEGGYERGSQIMILYAVSLFYVFLGVMYLFRYKRFLDLDKWFALISLYALTTIAIILQLIYENLLVELFSTSIAFMIVVLFVLRPEEITDPFVGLLSWKAYQTELYKVIATKQRVQVIILRLINADQIRSYLGEEPFYACITDIAARIDAVCRGERISFELYFEHPGSIYLMINDADRDMSGILQKLYSAAWDRSQELKDMGVRFLPRICRFRYPEDIASYDDIIHFGHEFFGLVPYDRIYSSASEIKNSPLFAIRTNLDSILNRAITAKRLEMYYQPIYSVKEKRFVSAEALLRLNDSEFGMIPPGLFIPAAESRGLIVPIGNFVLEDVHRFISENDLDELGLSYIEINLSVAQCLQRDLPERMKRLSDKYGVSTDKINLEITETTYDNIGEVMEQNLTALKEEGYSF